MDESQFQSELKESDIVSSTYVSLGNTRQTTLEDWTKVFHDISPNQLKKRFKKAAGETPISLNVGLFAEHSSAQIKIDHDYLQNNIYERENNIYIDILPDKWGKLSAFFLDWNNQGKNIAKRYLQTSVDLLKSLGANHMKVGTNEIGSYAWAKYGFTPESESDWDSLKAQIRKRINNGKLIFDNVEYDISLELPVINKILDAEFKDLSEFFPKLTELNRQIDSYKGHSLTVGKALLIDTEWCGKLPFDEQSPSFKRFKSYTDVAAKDMHRGAD